MLASPTAARTLTLGLAMLSPGLVCAQNYPTKPIRVVTAEPGGVADIGARIIAQALASSLGQQLIVDNRPVQIAIDTVAKAPPDGGYTLLFTSNTLWIQPLLQKMAYDPIRDFSPISPTNRAPNIIVVNVAVPVKSVSELIALAKARPGELNYATSGVGTPNHLGAELFKAMAQINIVRIPYKGGAFALNAMIAGEVQIMVATAGSVAAHVKSGRVKALAVTSAEPSVLFPGLPTASATGLPGYECQAVNGMLAPASTPAAVITRLNQEIIRAVSRADVKERFLSAGLETVSSTPQEFAASIKSEIATLGKVIKDANIRVD